MRIVIDMQGAQTESRFRGIGRYTLSFAQGIVRNRGEHEVFLALSGLFPDTIEPIREAFDGLLPQENIRVWYAPGPVREVEPANAWRRKVAELIREAFLASLRPDVIHISSLFEGYVDDAVTSIGRFDKSTPVSVSLYDLIPLLWPEQYLQPNPSYRAYYERKVEHLSHAKVMLAISDSSRNEVLDHLDFASERVVNVSTAIDDSFKPLEFDKETVAAFNRKFNITRPFILYTGGADERKNLPRLIQAYARLAPALRERHQLVLAGKISESVIDLLKQVATQVQLAEDEVRFVGYVTDDDLIALYNLCAVFVFPSWHEGFGLPALEAMSCGAAVIASNVTSLPEVVGQPDALFDPLDLGAIAEKMTLVLEEESFSKGLRAHGLVQARKFSWDNTAQCGIAAFESIITSRERAPSDDGRRMRLAFVSPLPPERTGIADYAAELLPALAEYYDLELVVTQVNVDDPWVKNFGRIRSIEWLREHSQEIDRVIYQIGNSPFHQHMLGLMQEIPGTVVLHDFFLSSMLAHDEIHGGGVNTWVNALYAAHGYKAVQARFYEEDLEAVKRDYPANLEVLQHAQGVIVHSDYSRALALDWYGSDVARDWRVIPLVRTPAGEADRARARADLSIAPDCFLVCSFGFLDSTKLNHRLLRAWLGSQLAAAEPGKLVFVGQNHEGEYGFNLLKTIREHGLSERVQITGFAEPALFKAYLAAADIAVQLRTSSRGETSAAVLDCMNHGVATVVNANGAMAEMTTNAVWMLPDEFSDDALVEALNTLWQDAVRRRAIGQRAREVINTQHSPSICARLYREAIEDFHRRGSRSVPNLLKAIATFETCTPSDFECKRLAESIAKSLPLLRPKKRIFLDITATCRTDLKTGIERVARAMTLALIEGAPAGYRIEPVRLSYEDGCWVYRYARSYTLRLIGCPEEVLDDEIVEPENGDILVGLDLSGISLIEAEASGLFRRYRDIGVRLFFTVFDLLPVQMPEMFPHGADTLHAKWLQAVVKCNGALCISKAVADELAGWVASTAPERKHGFQIAWFHLGADVDRSSPTRGLPIDAVEILEKLRSRPSFLMVGTVEPRKGYLQTIEAFSLLWGQGCDVNLVIVGREGWLGLPNEARRTIPETVRRLRNHSELGKRLLWLEGISDEYLEEIYSASSCLLAASEGEGFGLPLIEAAQRGLPIIARDIPVFREVAANFANYFVANTAEELAGAIAQWLRLFGQENNFKLQRLPTLTWAQSAERLLDVVLTNAQYSDGQCPVRASI